ncbi:hypothetical protein PENTCL1PPCAC_22772, partial [Pristionchus entomophagus]
RCFKFQISGSVRIMEHFIPEIFWHDRASLLSIDIDENNVGDDRYRIATCSMQKEIRMWELVFEPCIDRKSTELAVNFIANITGHQHSINTVQFHTFNKARYLASGDSEGRLIIWTLSDQPPGPPEDPELPPNKENWVKQKMIHHDSDVTCLAWQPNGSKLASLGRDNNLLIHDIPNGKRVLSVYNLREFPNGMAWDPLGRYIVTQSTDRKMEVIDALKGTKLRLIYAVDFPSLTFSSHTTDPKPTKLFYDDQMMSFKRLPSFSPCGQLVVVPCAHIESRDKNFYGNYVFTRKDVISSGKPSWLVPSPKATFLVKMCPVIWALDENVKENYSGLPHRVIWLSLTDQAIIFYDSQHCGPIAYVDNIHYLKLTDASWSRDGKLVAVSSMEGYCSFLRLSLDKWGVKLIPVPSFEASPEKVKKTKGSKRKLSTNPPVQSSPVPPTPKTPKPNSLLKFFGKATPQQKPTDGENTAQSERPQKRIKLITLE